MGTALDLRELGGANVYLRKCPSRTVFEVVANKWSGLAVGAMADGPVRFNELRRRLDGITQKMLTQTLRMLERDGLVKRTLYPTIPPRVEYELTDLGRSVNILFAAIRDWAEIHVEEIFTARDDYDRRAAEEIRPVT
jgi:DNA-binding HxlR family transcriptional regulator